MGIGDYGMAMAETRKVAAAARTRRSLNSSWTDVDIGTGGRRTSLLGVLTQGTSRHNL